MSGEDLYNRYRFCMADEGMEIDKWEHLTNREKDVWTSLAGDLGLADDD